MTGLQEHGADISICNYWFKEENKMSPACRLESCLVASNSHMNYCKYGLLLITVWGKLFKRDVIYNIFFDMAISFGEDSLFVAQALKKASRIFFNSDTLYVYRISKSFGKYGIGSMEEAVSVWDKIARMQEPESIAYWSARFIYLKHIRQVVNQDGHTWMMFQKEFKKNWKTARAIKYNFKETLLLILLAYAPSVYFLLYRKKDNFLKKLSV